MPIFEILRFIAALISDNFFIIPPLEVLVAALEVAEEEDEEVFAGTWDFATCELFVLSMKYSCPRTAWSSR
jgi:hypothetical protein